MKRGPVFAMMLTLALGVWLVWSRPGAATMDDLRPGASTHDVLIAHSRGVLESHTDPATGAVTFRIMLRDGWRSPVMSAAELSDLYGPAVLARATGDGELALFRLFNITTWAGLAWIGVGLGGQACFFGRMLIQWVVSEKERRSIVPPLFWWLSFFGGIALFAYFVWRKDVVGVLGQSTGIVIYARNLRLIRKHERRSRRQAQSAPAPPGPAPADSANPPAHVPG